MDPVKELQGIKDSIAEAERKRARYEADRAIAEERRDEAIEHLKKFGVSTVEEAEAKIASEQADLEKELKKIRSELEEVV